MVTPEERVALVSLSSLLGQCAMLTHHMHSGDLNDQQEVETVNALNESLGAAMDLVDTLSDAREGTPIMVAVPNGSDSEE